MRGRSSGKRAEDQVSLVRERRSQLRGLLVLAAVVLGWILFRADRHAIFHAGWWRF